MLNLGTLMKNFKALFLNLKESKAFNNFITSIKNILRNAIHHLDTIFVMLFFFVKFVLPKIVLPKFLCIPSTPNFLFEDMFSVTSFQQETFLYLLLSQLAVRFTIKISVLFLTATALFVLAIFCVFLFLGKSAITIRSTVLTKPTKVTSSFYTHKIQFLN